MTTETLIAISFLLSSGHISDQEVQSLNLKPHEIVKLRQPQQIKDEELPANLESVINDTYIKIKSGQMKELGSTKAPTTDTME